MRKTVTILLCSGNAVMLKFWDGINPHEVHVRVSSHANILIYSSFYPTFQLCPLELLKMCRGREDGKQGRLAKSEVLKEAVSDDGGGGLVSCELCSSRALLYCQADDAFLCQKCDRWVHGANFLAFRHIRCLLCSTCQNLTQRYLIGSSHEVALPTMISWTERSWCNSSDESKCPRTLKMPFLFI